MSVWTKIAFSCALFAFLVSAGSASSAFAQTKFDDYDVKIKLDYSSGFDSSASKTASTSRSVPVLPITLTANKSKGTSTSQLDLNAALLFNGSFVTIAVNPTTLLAQYRPIKNKPATLVVDFDDFELEADDHKLMNGFTFNDFRLVGTVPNGGYVKIKVDLEADVEGPGVDIDDRDSGFSKTFTSNFNVSFLSLFGSRSIFGKDISNRRLEKVELEGKLQFEVLGTQALPTVLQVQ
jgi:hypothetical protein